MRMRAVAVGVVLTLLAFAPSASAGSLLYQYGNAFSGDVAPSTDSYWLQAIFEDTASGVTLTLTAPNLQAGQFVSKWYFNIDDAFFGSSTSYTPLFTAQWVSGPVPSIERGRNSYKADGDGNYDILLSFPEAQASRFETGDTAVLLFTGTVSGLNATDFDFLSNPAGGHGPFLSAAHIQGLTDPNGGTTSAWVSPGTPDEPFDPVPEPASMLLLGTGLLGAGLAARRRKR